MNPKGAIGIWSTLGMILRVGFKQWNFADDFYMRCIGKYSFVKSNPVVFKNKLSAF
jgi:hypothetical protein